MTAGRNSSSLWPGTSHFAAGAHARVYTAAWQRARAECGKRCRTFDHRPRATARARRPSADGGQPCRNPLPSDGPGQGAPAPPAAADAQHRAAVPILTARGADPGDHPGQHECHRTRQNTLFDLHVANPLFDPVSFRTAAGGKLKLQHQTRLKTHPDQTQQDPTWNRARQRSSAAARSAESVTKSAYSKHPTEVQASALTDNITLHTTGCNGQTRRAHV